jgi:hypothetical protein
MKKLYFLLIIIILITVSCSLRKFQETDKPVEKDTILNLLCGPMDQSDCLLKLCDHTDSCPIIRALSINAVFDFVNTYSQCPDCNTPVFSPERGIGKCIEYISSDNLTRWQISIWVSENCSFRYANPTESKIQVILDPETMKIDSISPSNKYLIDPNYCQTNADCLSLSGSGVPFTGCQNYFYAPLNWSGYFSSNLCGCNENQCVEN